MPNRRTYETEAIRVHWDSSRCIHTAICLNALPHVFDVQARPWVRVEAADADAVAETVERCPTGALRYERLDESPGEEPSRPTDVIPIPNGPLLMVGDLDVQEPDGTSIAHEGRLTLCRCGMSRNQPFCDNSHMRHSWESGPAGAPVKDYPPPREGASEEPTKVVATADGYLDLRGHIRVRDSRGEVLCEVGRTFLCRCGQSRTKPFCDSSHEQSDFCSKQPEVERERLEADTPAAFTPNPHVPDPKEAA